MDSSGQPVAGNVRNVIHTPDHRLRVFVSSTLDELEPERLAVRDAILRMRLVPVMFELGVRAHPPHEVYQAYLEQSQLFIGIYGESYGSTPDAEISGVDDEYRAAEDLPKLIYVKTPAPDRDPRLHALLDRIRADARVSYRHFRSADELGEAVGDDIALLLTERFRPGGHSPALAGDLPTAALPVPPNPLLGRRAEQRALRDLLTDDDVRLVTLTGPGGVGKTRLAIEVGATLSGSFADGVRFADLSAISDPSLVGAALAQSLSLRTMPNRSAADDVVAYLRNRSLLLIVDNMEHLAMAAPVIATVLDAAPAVTVLVTSRVPLRLTYEHVFEVPPLSIPDPAEDPVAAVRRDGAAMLFLERARAVRGVFPIGPDDAAAIVEIVRRLDGLPLAIELAAAKTRILTPRALLDRLASRLGTLTGGARDLPARQRTLRDTIAWSYQLLPADEQRLFARLGVFAGGFDLAGIDAVAGFAERYAELEALGALVESSLITPARQERETRFTMLGIIREYALERLRDAGDWNDVHDRHARHFVEFAVRSAPPIGATSTDPAAVDRLEAEHDNLRAAVSWLIDTRQWTDAVRLAWLMWQLWWLRGHVDEAARTVRRLLDHVDEMPPLLQANVLFGDGAISFLSGDPVLAREKLERALPKLRQYDDGDVTARAAGMLGQLALDRGDYDEAQALLGETREIGERLGEEWMAALYYTRLGLVPFNHGDYAGAAEQFTDGLRVARKTEDHLGEVVALYSLAVTSISAGDLDGAEDRLQAGLRVSASARDEAGAALYLRALADLAARRGNAERSVRLAAAARKLGRFGGAAWMRAYVPTWPTREPAFDTSAYPEAWAQGTEDTLRSAVAFATEP
ncbi:DUF4062 domain-containing protein [Asanoa sp. NPDC049573]|uniref:DUF4062 domain-containing protein n=1 Tax=Asanoa sp. NPDC049573 TaxID=3155396 RepID=UPI003429CA03